ncbi:MAG: hypothetical protein GY855_12050 [candidate division Zixibacteria bacterium]|nr:hypothetical protein [candidate division Zixibacteria bacterium]
MNRNKQWRLIRSKSFSGEINMAFDMLLLNSLKSVTGKPTLRFFRWNNPTISYGANQKNIERIIDSQQCRKYNITVVKRPTGGRELLHGYDLSYSVVGHIDSEESAIHSIKKLCARIHDVIIRGLIGCGLKEEGFRYGLAGQRGYDLKETKPCFISVTGNEISYYGKKIVGSAQKREDNVFLQHGSIQLVDGTVSIAKLLNIGEEERNRLYEKLRNSVTSLQQALGYEDGIESNYRILENKIVESFSDLFGVELNQKNITEKEMQAIKQITNINL